MSRAKGVAVLTLLSLSVLLIVLGSAATAFAVPAATLDGPLYADPHYYTGTGYYAESHAVGDVNNDGHPDVVVPMLLGTGADEGLGGFRVFLNDGTGTLSEATTLAVDGWQAKLGDLDGDGNLDAVVQKVTSVEILRGDGTGAFSDVASIPVSYHCGAINLADFNNDSIPDLLIINTNDDGFVYLGNGDCTFTLSSVIGGLGYNTWNQTGVGDFNNDGNQDFMVINYGSNTLDIRLGDGTGIGFTALPDMPVNAGPARVALGDIDHDGILDLAVAPSDSGTITVYAGDGTGGFVDGYDTLVGFHAHWLEFADINMDANPDLIVAGDLAGMNNYSRVQVLLGDGTGAFPASAVPSVGTWWAYGGNVAHAIDLDGNGAPDLTTTHSNSNWSNNIVRLWNTTAVTHVVRTQHKAYAVSAPETLTVPAPGVLTNDAASGVDTISAAAVDTPPAHGTLVLDADGAFRYTPDPGFSGDDTFKYVASSLATASAPETVTITVTGEPGHPPTALALSNDTVAENEPAGTVVGTLTSTDPTSTSFTYSIVGGADAGAFTIDGDQLKTAASFDYESQALYYITVRTTDEIGGYLDQDFTILVTNVLEAPVTAPDAYTTDEDTLLPVSALDGVLKNDIDPEYATSLVPGPFVMLPGLVASVDTTPAHGALTLNSDGSFVYTPDADWNGVDHFTYTATGAGGTSAPETVTMTVNAVNDPPSGLTLSNDSIDENVAPLGLVGYLYGVDVDSGSFYYTLLPGPDKAFFTIFMGSELRTTEAFDYETTSTFSIGVRVTDLDGASHDETFTIYVNDVNEAPSASADTFSTNEDAGFTSAGSVLDNDTDPDGDTLTAVLDAGPAFGSLTLRADGTFDYTPDANQNGTDHFHYHATDGSLDSSSTTVTIDVAATNDAPTGISLSDSSIAENNTIGSVIGTLTATDIDSSNFTYEILAGGDASAFSIDGDHLCAAVSFDHEAKSDYTVWIRVTDDGAAPYTGSFQRSFPITVTDVNEAPVAADDSYNTSEDHGFSSDGSVLDNDTDPESDALTATLEAGPSHGSLTLRANGTFDYTPDTDWNGTDHFTYRASDGSLSSAVATVTIGVAAVNDAPTDIALSNTTVAENEPAGTAVGTLSATDVDSTSFTFAIRSGGDGAAFSISGDQLLTAQPFDFETKSSYLVPVRVTDDGWQTYDETLTITVTNVNEPPAAANDSYETTEGVALSVPAPGVLANDGPDPDGDTFIAIDDSPASHGTYTLNADGSFTYTPDAGFYGTDSFGYRAMDPGESSGYATVTITVNRADAEPPVTTSDALTSYKGEAVITLTATDTGTGVAATYWKLDGAAAVAGTSVHVVTTGAHTLQFWSVDNADNVEATKVATFTVASDIIPIQGDDRYGTAIRTSQVAFPDGSDYAVICRGNLWADVSGGSALAGAVDAPLLLTLTDKLPAGLETELDRLGAKHLFILGDTHAISAEVATQLAGIVGEGGSVERIGGYDRYDTARKVAIRTWELLAQSEGYTGDVFLATGEDFPDAIAAAPLATRLHMPIVLTRKASLSTEASEALVAIHGRTVHILGDPNAVSALVETQTAGVSGVTGVSRLAGPDRFRTAIAVATYGVSRGLEWNGVAIGTGLRFPDALAGGVMQGHFNSVVLLTRPDVLNPYTAEVLRAHKAEIGFVRILGGPAAVSEAVRVQVNDALK